MEATCPTPRTWVASWWASPALSFACLTARTKGTARACGWLEVLSPPFIFPRPPSSLPPHPPPTTPTPHSSLMPAPLQVDSTAKHRLQAGAAALVQDAQPIHRYSHCYGHYLCMPGSDVRGRLPSHAHTCQPRPTKPQPLHAPAPRWTWASETPTRGQARHTPGSRVRAGIHTGWGGGQGRLGWCKGGRWGAPGRGDATCASARAAVKVKHTWGGVWAPHDVVL